MAHLYTATIRWERGEAVFTDGRYSRAHRLIFDGLEVPGSSAPSSVRVPLSREDALDPEEAVVAALSSCHMLFFLDFARRAGFTVDSYTDAATGEMAPNDKGKLYLATITLKPNVVFSGSKAPTAEEVEALHHHAHEECYIANSVRGDVLVLPEFSVI
ncbi:peroxiredoxin [Azorhizobium oxalatiphilum]|uniref:Peroxiredoxin n=1 Tax=Azorhizobium oxalatiphilum TaxID=980631 RepID=A0A917BKI2_9HYPH|nr:OsmC family protein [Azorhizobium oxalatiphilum]GGF45548.1 peroxiredoxin [Azorhizobium oxalatiphilum]